jgi:CAAX amino terminal protease family.
MEIKKAPHLLNNLILAAPAFLFYQIGLLVSPKATNGVDPFTHELGYLFGLSWQRYLLIMIALIVIYSVTLKILSRKGRFDPHTFPWLLMESGIYALIMGPTAHLFLRKLHVLSVNVVKDMGIFDRLVASAGAGFYEELVFRLLILSALGSFFVSRGMKRFLAYATATVVSAFAFSAIHYIGAIADPFDMASFLYRALLGIMLGAIFIFRGFAPAVYTHALYDAYVMCVLCA